MCLINVSKCPVFMTAFILGDTSRKYCCSKIHVLMRISECLFSNDTFYNYIMIFVEQQLLTFLLKFPE